MYAASLTVAVWTLTSKRVLKREKPWSALPLADNCSSNVWESPQPLPVIQSNKTIRLYTSLNRVYNTHMGKSIPLKPGCALPCLPARERPAHPYSPLSWPSARPPPCPPPVLLHNSAQCSQCISKNFELFCNAVLVFDCIAWLGCWGQTWAKRSPSINLCLSHSLWAQVIDSKGRTNGYNQVLIHAFQLVVATFVQNSSKVDSQMRC